MKTILTLKYGTKYSSEDVNRIYNSIESGYNHVCITDNPVGLNANIKTIPLPKNLDGHWYKLWMYSLDNLGDIIYLDLDVRIQKNVSELFNFVDIVPTICYTYWKDDEFPNLDPGKHSMRFLSNYNSSVVLWKSGTTKGIWELFESNLDYYMVKYYGDDRFLWHENLNFNVFPKGLIYSFTFGADILDRTKFLIRRSYIIALLNGSDLFPNAANKYDELFMH